MKRFLGFFAVAMAIVGLSTAAQAQRTLTYARVVAGLDAEGFLIPGTAQLTVTLNVDSSIVGPDFDEGSAVNIIQSLGFTETAPAAWTYAGLVAGDNNPDIKPANGATGDFGFAWITPPATPFSFSYKVNLPNGETGPVSFTGEADYRTNGGSIFANAGSTLVEVKPTTVSLTRTLSGAGITGPLGQYYVPGQNIIVDVTLTKDGDDTVQALGAEETVPAGWTFAGLVAGDNNPDIKPANGAAGPILGFGWITPPAFPFSFSYRIAVPGGESASDRVLKTVGKYRLGGGEILTNTDMRTLNSAPCTTLGLAGEGGNFYAAGAVKNIVITVDSTCTTTIQALGVNATLPAGWSYGGLVAGDNNPDIKPANNATGTLGFAWITPPATPFTFTIKANVPALEVGDKDISGLVEYRLSGDALYSEVATLTLSGADLVAPVITLNGNATETVECGGVYTDAGATASDDRDGDITGSIVSGGSVDTTTPGDYVLTFDVSDVAGNAATQVTRTVTVSDTTIPVITLTGNATVTVQCSGVYTDAGATVTDSCDTAVAVVVGGDAVNTASVGSYVVTYDATDASGNAATQVSRTVNVVDTTAPVITRIGAASVNAQCGSVYVDAGATASDTCAGNLTGSIVTVNPVNTAITGVYTVTYNVSDGTNAATQVTRTVNVVDTTAPVVTINGLGAVVVECGGSFNDAGATASDVCDSSVSVTSNATTAVNEAVPATYTVTYSATDDSGNTGTATRSVIVTDTTAPVITLNGNASVTVECGGVYTEAGASVADTCDTAIDAVIGGDAVNTASAGTYVVTYNASDASGNAAAQVTRTVTVSDTTIPVITLIGNASVTVECGGSYTDAGATAIDACDGNITGSILVNSDLNTAAPGTYTFTYDVQDSSGNAGVQVVRTVTVADTVNPVVTLNGGNETIECGGSYADAGATASDSCDGDLTGSIVVGGDTVDTSAPNSYLITYVVADASGNSSSATRTVTVSDTTDPVITLNGDAAVSISCGDSYTDAGASATDSCDSAVEAVVDASGVDATAAGTYTVTITATDASGNSSSTTRSVTVVDSVNPVVTLFGDAALTIDCNGTYTEAGASATDACEGDLQVVAAGQVVTTTPGDYVITYSATDSSGNIGTATRTVTVSNNCPVEGEGTPEGEGTVDECADDDVNGIADNIFACLDVDGESLTLDVNGGTCTRRVYAVTWFGDIAGDDVAAVVTNPNDENQVVTVSVPRGVIGEGQQGILVVSIACSLEDLLGDEAFNLGTTPDGEVAGNAWFDVTIIVSEDGGASYDKLDNSALAGNPVTISINGLNASEDGTVGLQAYSTTIQPGQFGAQIFALVDTWSDDSVDSTFVDGTITAQVTELSVFGAFEVLPTAPKLQVSPNPASDYIVGITRPQESVNNTIKVKNVGGGTLSGQATINDPNGVFTLVGDATYVLGAGAEDSITVRFAPAGKLGNFTATLTLTNSAGVPVTVTLKATSAVIIKNFQILGCGPEGAAGNPAADLAVAMLALGALVLSSRALRRAKQS